MSEITVRIVVIGIIEIMIFPQGQNNHYLAVDGWRWKYGTLSLVMAIASFVAGPPGMLYHSNCWIAHQLLLLSSKSPLGHFTTSSIVTTSESVRVGGTWKEHERTYPFLVFEKLFFEVQGKNKQNSNLDSNITILGFPLGGGQLTMSHFEWKSPCPMLKRVELMLMLNV